MLTDEQTLLSAFQLLVPDFLAVMLTHPSVCWCVYRLRFGTTCLHPSSFLTRDRDEAYKHCNRNCCATASSHYRVTSFIAHRVYPANKTDFVYVSNVAQTGLVLVLEIVRQLNWFVCSGATRPPQHTYKYNLFSCVSASPRMFGSIGVMFRGRDGQQKPLKAFIHSCSFVC